MRNLTVGELDAVDSVIQKSLDIFGIEPVAIYLDGPSTQLNAIFSTLVRGVRVHVVSDPVTYAHTGGHSSIRASCGDLLVSGLTTWLPDGFNTSSYYPAYVPQTKVLCLHEWRWYEGLTQRYEYCTKCDEKKEQRGMEDKLK